MSSSSTTEQNGKIDCNNNNNNNNNNSDVHCHSMGNALRQRLASCCALWTVPFTDESHPRNNNNNNNNNNMVSSSSPADGIHIGSIVFAPYSNTQHSPNYALAEVTGIQVSAGTVTVSFVFSYPGVDDVAVSFFDLVPCPPAWLSRIQPEKWKRGGGGGGVESCGAEIAPCSLLEMLFQSSVHAGPVELEVGEGDSGIRMVHKMLLGLVTEAAHDDVKSFESPMADTSSCSTRKRGRSVEEMIAKEEEEVGKECQHYNNGLASWSVCVMHDRRRLPPFRYVYPTNIHTFYAHAFRRLGAVMDQLHSEEVLSDTTNTTNNNNNNTAAAAVVNAAPVVLCVFSRYAMLRRFEVFMACRGHVVRLVDGEDEEEDEGEDGVASLCTGRAPQPTVSFAFSHLCKVWLCMLRDDAADVNELPRLLRGLPPVDYLLTVREEEEDTHGGEKNDQDEEASSSSSSSVDDTLHGFLPHLRSPTRHMEALFFNVPSEGGGGTASAAASGGGGGGAPSQAKIKVSGSVFAGNKILVAASREQLLLMQTVMRTSSSSDGADKTGGSAPLLSPALLERIALGNFTDASAKTLFDSLRDVVATTTNTNSGGQQQQQQPFTSIRELQHKFYSDPSRFSEAFPVFEAVGALVRDIFHSSSQRTSPAAGSFPRVALVLPRGNPTGSPLLTVRQFMKNLRSCLAPWHLMYDASPPHGSVTRDEADLVGGGGGGGGMPQSVVWSRQGGLLLLPCDEACCQLGALHHEADVVIACGKTAAAWVAANSEASPCTQFFAILSEVEVAGTGNGSSYVWMPYSSSNNNSPSSYDEAVLLRDQQEQHVHSHSLMEAVAAREADSLWKQLRAAEASKTCSRDMPKVLQQAITSYNYLESKSNSVMASWGYLRDFLKRMALACSRAEPLPLSEVEIS